MTLISIIITASITVLDLSFGSFLFHQSCGLELNAFQYNQSKETSGKNSLEGSSSILEPERTDTYTYVFTPNGSFVMVGEYDELDTNTIEEYNVRGDNCVPEAVRISSSSRKYNCHSFAWYQPLSSNPFWMVDPSNYYTDGSYEESLGEPNDVICYYDSNNNLQHSGIVIERMSGTTNNICGDSNLVRVRSKWGQWGLYEHRGDQCPYTFPYGGIATYVKYYKPRTNEIISLLNPETNSTQIIQRSYTVTNNSSCYNYSLYGLDVYDNKIYDFQVASSNELDVRLYDKNFQAIYIDIDSDYTSGTYLASFSTYLSNGRYYLRNSFYNSSAYGAIYTEISYSHSHMFDDHFSYLSQIFHKEYCSCGSFQNKPHTVTNAQLIGGHYFGYCIYCGALIDVGENPIIYGFQPIIDE